ncbi:MAG: zinc ribbon domain-containing protein [Microthrixaceae bacterium]
MGSLEALLTLQEIDTALDQLRHRREALPERDELLSAQAAVSGLESEREAVFAKLSEVRHAEKAAEDEAASVEDKAAEVERMLYGGTITAAKELEAYQADLVSLRERQGTLEDTALELLETAEPLESELEANSATMESATATVTEVEARLGVAEAGIDDEIAQVEAGRAAALEPLDPDVVEQYVMLRRSLGGTGAARLNGARCEGCHLEIPSAQLEEVRHAPDDAMVNCPECGRILVR